MGFKRICLREQHLVLGSYLKRKSVDASYFYYYTSDSLWKIWLVESIQSIHNSLWTWHDKCNICCRYCIYHVKFNVCLVTKPLGVFSSETEWLNTSLLFLRMNYGFFYFNVYFIQTKVLLLYFNIFKWSWLSLSVSLSP